MKNVGAIEKYFKTISYFRIKMGISIYLISNHNVAIHTFV